MRQNEWQTDRLDTDKGTTWLPIEGPQCVDSGLYYSPFLDSNGHGKSHQLTCYL